MTRGSPASQSDFILPRPIVTALFIIPLTHSSTLPSAPTFLHTIYGSYTVRTVVPAANCLLMTDGRCIHVVKWLSGSYTLATIILEPSGSPVRPVSIQPFCLNLLTFHVYFQWDEVIALQYCDPYILCVRSYAIELHPIPHASGATSGAQKLPILKYPLGQLSLYRASFSSPIVSFTPHEPDPQTVSTIITVFILGHNIHQGILLHKLSICLPPTGTVDPTLNFCVALIYPEKYVTSLALGPQAMRGMWVATGQRDRRRYVMVLSNSFEHRDADDVAEPGRSSGQNLTEHRVYISDTISACIISSSFFLCS